MATTTVTVKVTTAASLGAVLNSDPLDFSEGRATGTLTLAKDNVLTWGVSGSPGEKYSIALSVPANRKIVMLSGTNPVNSRISTQRFRGAGHITFEVV